ncbi:MAG: hypothetical protein NUW09_01310, partial [Deltaproteobacteria bacterium]|nr:hypothetical protein [Deltaproteobacteria bacterium]
MKLLPGEKIELLPGEELDLLPGEELATPEGAPSVIDGEQLETGYNDVNQDFIPQEVPIQQPPKESTPILNKFKSAGGAVGGMVEMAGGAISAMGTFTQKIYGESDKIANFEKSVGQSVTDYGKKMAEFYKVEDPTFGDKLASAAASGATFLLPGTGIMRGSRLLMSTPKLAALAASGMSSVFESGLEAGGVYNSIIEKGGSEIEALAAAGKTFAANVALNTGLNYAGGLFGKLAPGTKAGTLKDAALSAGRAMGAESVQEGSQQVISNVFGKDPIWEGVGESALLGGLVGGGMSVGMDVANRIDNGPTPPGGMPVLPIPPTISPDAIERAKTMALTNPVAAMKSVMPISEWGNIDAMANQLAEDIIADQSVPGDQKQVIHAKALNDILLGSLPAAPIEAAPEEAPTPEAQAEDAAVQQAME